MDVTDIINRIAELSLDEDNPDTDAQNRILNFVNLGYMTVLQEIESFKKTRTIETQDVTVTSGVGTLTTEPVQIVRVVDVTNKNVLDRKEIWDIVDVDPLLEASGNPNSYYMTDTTTINVYPKDSVTLKVYYTPKVADLTLTSTSADIEIPYQYQDILVEAGLLQNYIAERDLTDAATLNNTSRKYEDKLARLKQFMFKNNKSDLGRLDF